MSVQIKPLIQYFVFFGLLTVNAVAQKFALPDGGRVVFYGDSITAQRLYTRFVESAVITRYPLLRIQFANAGVPGDTVAGGYAGIMSDRVRRDVAPFRPTMIAVMLGMNDGGYGYTPVAKMHTNFLTGYAALLEELHKAEPTAKLTLVNPTPYDEITHGTEFPGYSGLVSQLSEDVTKIAKQNPSALRADLNTPMVEALAKAKMQFPQLAPLLVPDRIHPADVAHWIMASALLEAWHINPLVSRVAIDAKAVRTMDSQRAVITKLERTQSGLQWMQLDEALPLPIDLNNAMTPVLLKVSNIEQMDQQTLRVDGLEAGSYQLLIDSKIVATFSNAELQHGVNLAVYKTPMWEQARGIDFLEERRATLDLAKFILIVELKKTDTSVIAEDKLGDAGEEFAETARTRAVPKPHTFELRLQSAR